MATTPELTGPDLAAGIELDALTHEVPLLGHAGGEPVVVVRRGDEVHALGASCTHYGGPLAEGLVVGHTIRCPWHHACFDLRDGSAIGGPALTDLPCFDVQRTGTLVQVRSKRSPAPKPKPKASPVSVVLVGAGAAAAACAEGLRKGGYEGPIVMIGDEAPGPVDRPNLSKDYLAGTAPEEWIPLGSREHYAAIGGDLLTGDPVVVIDTAGRSVTTKSGRRFPYGALLYAPGAEPIRLDIPGADAPHVHTLRTLADAEAIIAGAAGKQRAVVIGASFIGLEAAASLVARGLEVHVVGREDLPLARVLGPELGRFVQKLHEDKGVRLHLGRSPSRIEPGAVLLDDGTRLDADLVVMGVGVKPRVSLAERAGLTVDRGVVVDESLRTSAPEVWAAGDVALHPNARVGGAVRIEHWVVAERQGQAAARGMLGDDATYTDVPFFWSAHYDVTIGYVGHAPSWDALEVLGSLDSRDVAVAYRKDGRVLAVATIGRDMTSLRVEAAMRAGNEAAILAALET